MPTTESAFFTGHPESENNEKEGDRTLSFLQSKGEIDRINPQNYWEI
ncbi:hypothetical protein D515_04558 [Grimontia indica]|uniref:Uncharacterized protein n=1 Tax=Grimontia indica TaxID=1056512 RepID=R1GYB2_9GAMM|nr:hypothetical protein D515_04558 [Grimontia indica]